MAAPSLSELAGLIQQPGPMKYADFGLDEHAINMRKLGQQDQGLALDQQRLQQQDAQAKMAELGRNARAAERMGLQQAKFQFEQEQAKVGQGLKRQEALEKAYAMLADANDRGDVQGVEYAKQAIQRLGGEVTPGAPPPGSTLRAAPPPDAAAPAPTSLDLTGIPRPRAARVGLPEPGVQKWTPPGMSGAVTAGMAAQGRIPPPPGDTSVSLPEDNGPAGGPLPQLPPATAFQAPEAGGAVTMGLAALGGRIPPPGGPPVPPEPVQLTESPAQPPAGPVESRTDAPQAAGFARGLGPLTSVVPPKEYIGTPDQAPAASATPAQQSPSAAPQQGQPGGLQILSGGKPVLSLGAPNGEAQVRNMLAPLLAQARTPEEKRRAQMAIDTGAAVVVREGVAKAYEAGMKVYAGEQANDRKTRVGTGRGVGEQGFGGSGRTKDELAVDARDADRYDNVIKLVTAKYGLNTEVMKADSALSSVEAAMNSNTGTGQLAAVTKALKAMGNTGAMSDRDLNRIMESSGVWNSFKNLIDRAQSGSLPPELMGNLKQMTGQLRSVIRQKRQEAAEDARLGILNEPFIYGDRESLAASAAGFFSGYAPNSRAPSRSKKKEAAPAPQGSPEQSNPSSPAPAQKGKKSLDELL